MNPALRHVDLDATVEARLRQPLLYAGRGLGTCICPDNPAAHRRTGDGVRRPGRYEQHRGRPAQVPSSPSRRPASLSIRVEAPPHGGLRSLGVDWGVQSRQRPGDQLRSLSGVVERRLAPRALAQVLARVAGHQGAVPERDDRAFVDVTHAASPAFVTAWAKRRSARARSVPTDVAATPTASAISL